MNERIIFSVCMSIVTLAAIVGITIYNINDRKLMSENINRAVEKGVDPMSVRCSYANDRDLICVAFAASFGNHNPSSPIVNKK